MSRRHRFSTLLGVAALVVHAPVSAQDTTPRVAAEAGTAEESAEDDTSLADTSQDDTSLADASVSGPTVQDRVVIKENSLSLHAFVTTTFRGDFYDQVGVGGALAYYPIEWLGIEMRAAYNHSWLNAAAEQVQRDTGLAPDTRPRVGTFLLGGRLSLGYGKVQVGEAFVVHFDPQVVLSGGVTVAEEDRYLPTFLGGLGLLMHFEAGFQAQLDLLAIVDVESRNGRGAVATIGFAPFLSVGWHLSLEDL